MARAGSQIRGRRTPIPSVHAGSGDRRKSEWPREESNLRPQIRSLSLYPLSYGASQGVCPRRRVSLRSAFCFERVSYVRDQDSYDVRVELLAGETHQLV